MDGLIVKDYELMSCFRKGVICQVAVTAIWLALCDSLWYNAGVLCRLLQ